MDKTRLPRRVGQKGWSGRRPPAPGHAADHAGRQRQTEDARDAQPGVGGEGVTCGSWAGPYQNEDLFLLGFLQVRVVWVS